MKPKKKYYKAVRVLNDTDKVFGSAYNLAFSYWAKLEEIKKQPEIYKFLLLYKLRHKTIPKIGYIFAFENLQCTESFTVPLISSQWLILEGTGELATVNYAHRFRSTTSTLDLETWWDQYLHQDIKSPITPIGTVFLKSFFPLRIIS